MRRELEKIPFNPAEYGFVLNTVQIDSYIHLNERLADAHIAKKVGYNLEKYRAATANQPQPPTEPRQ
jgi:hypothetical protein